MRGPIGKPRAMDAITEIGKVVLGGPFGWWSGPRLRVLFDPAGEPQQAIVADAGNTIGWFYRLRVDNYGRGTADECQATLAAVEPVIAGPSLPRPATLKWAHEEDYRSIPIEPRESRKLDLFCIL